MRLKIETGNFGLEQTVAFIYTIQKQNLFLILPNKQIKKNKLAQVPHIFLKTVRVNIWFATEGQGVFAYDTTNKKLSQFESTPITKVNLSSNFVISLYIDTRTMCGVSVKSSTFPLYKYDNENHIFRSFPIKNLPPKFLVYAITADPDGNLWLGTWDTDYAN
jgi:ligand-binding sensor domain-containing protein